MSEDGKNAAAEASRARRLRDLVEDLLGSADISDELRAEAREDFVEHLSAEVERQLGLGLSLDEALERARYRFGGAAAIRRELEAVGRARASQARRARREQRRGGQSLLDSLLLDLRFALRNLARAPLFAAIVVFTLALGIGANTAIFTLVDTVLLRPLPFSDPARLVRVWPEKRFDEEMLAQVEERTTSFATLSALDIDRFTLVREGQAEVLAGAVVEAGYFAMLGVTPALGRLFVEEDSWAAREDVVVLGHGLFARRFGGDAAVIGTTIDLGGAGLGRRKVVGVLPATYRPLIAGTEVWVPMATDPASPAFRNVYAWSAVARLRPGVTLEAAAAEMRTLVVDFTAAHPTQFREGRISPRDVVPLQEDLVDDVRSVLLLLLVVVGLVLLVACANVANLLLSRSAARQREISVRSALGASRWRLVRLLLSESLTLGLLGAAIGAAGARYGLALARPRLVEMVPRAGELRLDLPVFAIAVGIGLVSCVLFGVAPALRLTARPLALGSGARAGTPVERHRLNRALVAVEVGLSLVVVITAGLLLKSLWRLETVEVGFDPRGLVAVGLELPDSRYAGAPARRDYFERLFDRLEALPRVAAVGAISLLPLSGGNQGIPYLVEGQELPRGVPSLVANIRVVTPGYLSALGVPLLAGRPLSAADVEDGDPVALVNRTFARRHWDVEDALGRRILGPDGSPLATIVGVVGDVQQQGLSVPPQPELYLPAAQFEWYLRSVVVRVRGAAGKARALVQSTAHEIDPEVPVDVATMPEVIRSSLDHPRFFTTLFVVFAVLALVLGLVGVYGVVAHTTRARTRELGLRIVFGAGAASVLRLALVRAMLPVLLGVALGLGLTLVTSRLLSSLLFEVGAADPWVYAAVVVLELLAGAAASLQPAVRAARTDPVLVLREE